MKKMEHKENRQPGFHVNENCTGGELPDQVGARADRVVSRLRASKGDVLIF